MSDEQKRLEFSGVDKAAILLLSVGQEEAAEVFRYLAPREISRISGAMTRLRQVRKDDVEKVLRDFVDLMGDQTTIGVGAESFLKTALTKALGAERAGSVLDRVIHGGDMAGIEAIKWQEPRLVAEMIKSEHPQVVAVLLASMEPEQAAELVNWLPDRVVEEAIPRLATLDVIQPSALKTLNDTLEEALTGDQSQVKLANVRGVKAAAGILNRLEQSRSQRVLNFVRQRDEAMADKIHESMFVFADLAEVDDRSLQILVREVPPEMMVPALKGADAALREKFYRNMSERAVESLKEDIAAKGAMRLSDVERAQKEIIQIAQKLEQEGKIILRVEGGDVVA